MKKVTLYFNQGGSDKVYQAAIEKVDGGFMVNFAYGKRGSTLRTGSKTSLPVEEDKATKIFNALVKNKKSKGYSEGVDGTPYQSSDRENKVSGITCQLLNPIDETLVMSLCMDDDYCAQSKHDGERRLIERKDDNVYGINRKGLYIPLSSVLVESAKRLHSNHFIIDGEDMGDVLVAFDLLQYDGNDIRRLPYAERFQLLKEMVSLSSDDAIRVTQTAYTAQDKRRLFGHLKDSNHEGIVFKRRDSVWNAGRPNSGGNALKYKFYDECSVIVDKLNEGKRSVSFYVNDGQSKVALGNVTIPPNKAIPQPGEIIDVKYLYTVIGGSLYQPIYLKPRTDIDYAACSITQLKYKNESIAA